MKNKKRLIIFILLAIVIYLAFFLFSLNKNFKNSDQMLINDVSRLNPTHIKKIVKNEELVGLQETLSEARKNNFKVSIAGKRHSMGGHTFYKDAVVLDMTSFNKVLSVNTEEKTVTVQSGALWRQVIENINPYNLSVEVMQAYNGFTVGGSLSVNVHESDPNYGPLIETVKSFRLLLANGTILNVSRTQNPELFSLVIGGYGLFGVILDADLYLTENKIYEKQEYLINYTDYYKFFKKTHSNPEIKQIFARLSIARDKSLLRELVVTTYRVTNIMDIKYYNLEPSKIAFKKFTFGLSRKYNFGKKLRWYLQKEKSDLVDPKIISRNNNMNGDVGFLDYYSSKNTDILQEYFIPVEKLPEFIDDLRIVVEKNNLNLLSATIRYIPKNDESVLSYSSRESFGLVLYFNVGLSDKEQREVEKWTQELTDFASEKNGTYYLPYKLYASQGQIRRAYPNLDKFFEKKREYDTQELFMNKFYEKYAKNGQ